MYSKSVLNEIITLRSVEKNNDIFKKKMEIMIHDDTKKGENNDSSGNCSIC